MTWRRHNIKPAPVVHRAPHQASVSRELAKPAHTPHAASSAKHDAAGGWTEF